MKRAPLFIAWMTLWCVVAFGQQPQRLTADQEQAVRVRYPQVWERKIAEGTKVAAMKAEYDHRLELIPAGDLEDKQPLPLWFRAYLRDKHPDLPTSGPYQYPRVAERILEWMVVHPGLQAPPDAPGPAPQRGKKGKQPKAKTVAGKAAAPYGSNINLTNSTTEENSESSIAAWNVHPGIMIAAANNITGSAQRQFSSGDLGMTWSKTVLPLATGTSFQSDPVVAWAVDGTAWSATIGINAAGTSTQIEVYKSTDRGATWTFSATVSSGTNNDKEMMTIDTSGVSPFRDNIYLAWDEPGKGVRFVRSTDKGATWSSVTSISTTSAIGVHLTTDVAGHVYVAWPDVSASNLQIVKSTDGGATFGSPVTIAATNAAFEVSIPADCLRQALVYLSIGSDRSNGPRKGNLYATWTDRNGGGADPGCAGISSASSTNVFFSQSGDGGKTWSAPVVVHNDAAQTDHFNQWMDVDQNDGTITVIFYSTKDDPAVVPPGGGPATGRAKTNVYYVASVDGGTTWGDEFAISSAQTDETTAGADSGNEYGDYNGLVAIDNANAHAHAIWTDRRGGGDEQIFTTAVQRQGGTSSGPGKCSAMVLNLRPGDGSHLMLDWLLLMIPALVGIWIAYVSKRPRKLPSAALSQLRQ